MKRSILAAAATAAVTAALATPAQAVPVSLTYDRVYATAPASIAGQGGPLQVTADLDAATGAFTVQPADWQIQPFPATNSGGVVELDVDLAGPVSGVFDLATGRMTWNGPFVVRVLLGGTEVCARTISPATLSTQTSLPFPGRAFPTGAAGISGAGAFGAQWDLPPGGTGSGCHLVETGATNPYALWVGRDTDPFAPSGGDPSDGGGPGGGDVFPPGIEAIQVLATEILSIRPVRAGRTAKVQVAISTPVVALDGVRLCLVPKKPLAPRRSCQDLGPLAENAQRTLTYRVRTRGAKPGLHRFTLLVQATGLETSRLRDRIQVLRRR